MPQLGIDKASQAYKDYAPLGLRAVTGATIGGWPRQSGEKGFFTPRSV